MEDLGNRLFESKYDGFAILVFKRVEKGPYDPGSWKFNDVEAHLNDIMDALKKLYGKVFFGFINELLGLEKEVILHVFKYYGVLAIENYNNNTLVVKIPPEDVDKFLKMLKNISAWRNKLRT